MLTGLYETHIDVSDLDRSVAFYQDILNLELSVKLPVDAARADSHSAGARRVAIMWIGGRGHAALGLWERPAERINIQHFAFEVEEPDLASVMATLGSNNAPVSFAEFFVVLGPEHAATIAGAGWSRRRRRPAAREVSASTARGAGPL